MVSFVLFGLSVVATIASFAVLLLPSKSSLSTNGRDKLDLDGNNIKAARNTYYLAKESRNNQEKMLNSLTENVNDARKELEWAEMALMEAETSYENFDIIDDNMDDTSSEKHATTLVGYCVGPWIQLGYCRM